MLHDCGTCSPNFMKSIHDFELSSRTDRRADRHWRRGAVVSGVRQWTKLTHVGPGYNWDGWQSSSGYTISGCNQPTRSTQPCIPPGSLNRVPASVTHPGTLTFNPRRAIVTCKNHGHRSVWSEAIEWKQPDGWTVTTDRNTFSPLTRSVVISW